MSLPNYLAKIKSAGMYRFTFDKSQIPPAAAETMRLVVGYSEKGPFNNPVYIDNKQDFISIFGNPSKRLEKKGVFFHRLALQALSAGPILALNLKPFKQAGEDGTQEQVQTVTFSPVAIKPATNTDSVILPVTKGLDVRDLYDRDRFWKIDADQLPGKISKKYGENGYISISATDTKDTSCSIFARGCKPGSLPQYDVTVRDWYKNLNEEIPEYLEGHEDKKIADFFMEVYVFRGEFIDALTTGVLSDYFDETGHCVKSGYMNMFNEESDTLAALAQDSNSNFVGLYRGCVLPYFKDANGNYISLDILFNGDKDNHKMIMKIDDDDVNVEDIWVDYPIGWSKSNKNVNLAIAPTYVKGYEYGTITRASSAKQIHDAVFEVLVQEKGVFTALTNHVDSEYHYIIDTFNTLIEPGCGKKIILAELAKAKDNALAILNYPAHSEFLNKWTGFSLEKLERGEYNGEWYLPSEVNGASYCAFYTPLVFGEGLVKTTVPSAAVVSNNFMEKWNSRQPYYIVAGPNYGRMEYEGLIGPDYNYGRSDLDVLEPYGVNCMVYVPRKGTYINSNQTAKQRPVSALSKVHVRELVIYLQNEIEAMLENYQWELNTQTLRDTIKTKADTILEKIKLNGGVYDYINVCDGTNNTPEVIDNEMVILDTSIEPARGAGKMVQRLTIHKTGGISSLTK